MIMKKELSGRYRDKGLLFLFGFHFLRHRRLYNIPVYPLNKLSHHSFMKMICATLIVLSASVLFSIGKLSHQLSLSDSVRTVKHRYSKHAYNEMMLYFITCCELDRINELHL